MPQLGAPELLIVLVIVIVIFGAGKLPQIGGAIGQSIREFRDAAKNPNATEEEEEPAVRRRTAANKTEETEEEEQG